MLAKSQTLIDRWLDRHGAAVGVLVTVLAFVATVELVVHF
jgi:hypothetical protein